MSRKHLNVGVMGTVLLLVFLAASRMVSARPPYAGPLLPAPPAALAAGRDLRESVQQPDISISDLSESASGWRVTSGDKPPEAPRQPAGPSSTLTQALDRALDTVKAQEAEIARMEQAIGMLSDQLEQQKLAVKELTAQLQQSDTAITALQEANRQWKHSVIGFREEMRDAEEAEMQAIKEILLLLKGFQHSRVTEEEESN